MSEKREDRRVRMTRLLIRDSLLELMQDKSVSNISVKMICETAQINRSTFYAHYRDQFALLESIQEEIVLDLKRQIETTQFFASPVGAVSVLVQVLEYAKTRAPILRVLLGEHGNKHFQNEIMQLAQEKIMAEFNGELQLPDLTMEYLKCFAVSGLISIMQQWMATDFQDDVHLVAGLMMTLIKNGTDGLLSEFLKLKNSFE